MRTFKVLGGVGYLLLLVAIALLAFATPGLTAVGPGLLALATAPLTVLGAFGLLVISWLMISIAWILAGREAERGILTATGVLILVVPIITVIAGTFLALGIPQLLTTLLTVRGTPAAIFRILFTQALPYLGLIIVIGILWVITGILHLIALFVAGSEFGTAAFYAAGILLILAFIVQFNPFALPLLAHYVSLISTGLQLLALLSAAVGFFTAKVGVTPEVMMLP